MKHLKEYTELDKLVAFLQDTTGTITLSPAQQTKLERLDFCDNLLRKYNNSTAKVQPMLIKKFKVSKRTATNIIHECRSVFNEVGKVNKEYWRIYLAEKIAEMMDKCYKNKEYAAAAQFQKNLIKTIGLDKEDLNLPDWSAIQRTPILAVCDPVMVGLDPIPNLQKRINELMLKQHGINIEDVEADNE